MSTTFFLQIGTYLVMYHYDGVLTSEKEGPVYIGGERRAVSIDGHVTLFEGQIRC